MSSINMALQSQAPGGTELNDLLAAMLPSVSPETFVFCTFPSTSTPPPTLYTQMLFREPSSTTIISTLSSATTHNTPYIFPSKMITLNVHSSLEAVGFLAKITTALAAKGLGCNPVSAYFHDHIFVDAEKVDEAMAVLGGLVEEAKGIGRLQSTIDGWISGHKW